jgi:hypothetical protein
MGETRKDAYRLDFDRKVKVEIEALISILLTVWRAGASVMTLNGKSRIYGP